MEQRNGRIDRKLQRETMACLGVLAVLFVGFLAWQSLYAAGVVGTILGILFAVGPHLWDLFRHSGD